MDNLTYVTLFEFFDIFYCFPILPCFKTSVLFIIQQLVIIYRMFFTVCSADYRISGKLLYDFAIAVNDRNIQKISFTSVNTNNVIVSTIFKCQSYITVNPFIPDSFEINLYWDVNRKLRLRKTLILNQIIFKYTFIFNFIRILILDGIIFGMNNTLLGLNARKTIKHLSFAVQLIYGIFQITFIKQHFEIERMKIGRALAVFREVFGVNLEKIQFAGIYTFIYERLGNMAVIYLISLLFNISVELRYIIVLVGIFK